MLQAAQIANVEDRYSYIAMQVAEHVLHPDAHMFLQEDFYQVEPDVVAMIMMQLSLQAGLKTWDDCYKAAYAEMKQLHMQDTFLPKHWLERAYSIAEGNNFKIGYVSEGKTRQDDKSTNHCRRKRTGLGR
jgi:hypothetical protein